jgi:hypothetical protein
VIHVPDFDVVGQDDLHCTECGEEFKFLVSIEGENFGALCQRCFSEKEGPRYDTAIAHFADLLFTLLEMKENYMTQEEMHELYGEDEDDTGDLGPEGQRR